MVTVVLLFIFLSLLIFYGWQLAKLILDEHRIEALIPLSVVIGAASYIFLLNLTSYFINIEVNFYLTALFLFFIGLLIYLKTENKKIPLAWGLNKKETFIIFGTVLLIMFLNGFLSLRSVEIDELAGHHLPLARTIAEGNFPVRGLNLPQEPVVYHYGYNLLLAAFFKISGLSVWFGQDFNVFLFSGATFLLIFAIAKFFISHNLKAYFVALIAYFGGGFKFIHLFEGISPLYKKIILGQEVSHPFKFLSLVWESPPLSLGPLVKYMQFLWGPLGWALVFCLIYVIFKFINNPKNKTQLSLLIIVLLSSLALLIENSFLVIAAALFFYPFIEYLFKKNKEEFKQKFYYIFWILVISGLIVLFAGGSISGIFQLFFQEKLPLGKPIEYTFFDSPFSFYRGGDYPAVPFYGEAFVFNWGFLYFLIVPAIIYLLRKHFDKGLFLTIISFFSFIPPFLMNFNNPWQDTVARFYFLVNPLWGIIVGLFLFFLFNYFKDRKILKYLLGFLIVLILLDGLAFQFTRPFYMSRAPGVEKEGFIGRPFSVSSLESGAYKWVDKNTNFNDYFLFFKDESQPIVGVQNYKFILGAGRLAPIYSECNNIEQCPDPDHPAFSLYQKLIADCDSQILEKLEYNYLFVDNNWPKGLEEKCLAKNNLELKFNKSENSQFINIYSVN